MATTADPSKTIDQWTVASRIGAPVSWVEQNAPNRGVPGMVAGSDVAALEAKWKREQASKRLSPGEATRLIAESRAAQAESTPELQARVSALRDSMAGRDISVRERGWVYHPRGEHSFLRDLYAMARQVKSVDAEARLRRNNEEHRALMRATGLTQTATAGGEFLVPAYLVAKSEPMVRAGRPFLNALGTLGLPDRTNQLVIPKITTGSLAAVQTDGGTGSQQDWVTTSVTAQVQSSSARAIASWQFLDLSPGAYQAVLKDLLYATNSELSRDIISASNVANAKSLLNTGSVNTVTYTDSTPTAAEFVWPVSQAAALIAKNTDVSPSFALMSPRVWWGTITAGVDGNSRPIIPTSSNALGALEESHARDADPQATIEAGGSTGLVGSIAGVPITLDGNMPSNLGAGTNETRIIVLNRRGFEVYESAPVFRVADQANATVGQTQFTCSIYWAVVPRQPQMISVISGTGLIPQV
jgi:hypothetical protein